MKISKSLALLLALCMVFSLVACGNQQNNTPRNIGKHPRAEQRRPSGEHSRR